MAGLWALGLRFEFETRPMGLGLGIQATVEFYVSAYAGLGVLVLRRILERYTGSCMGLYGVQGLELNWFGFKTMIEGSALRDRGFRV